MRLFVQIYLALICPHSLLGSVYTSREDRVTNLFGSAFSPTSWESGNGMAKERDRHLYSQPDDSASRQEEEGSQLQQVSFSAEDDGGGQGKPRFHPSRWSECSVSCGQGVRSRRVECVAFQGITADMVKLPDYECEGQTKPVIFEPCHRSNCASSQSQIPRSISSKNSNKNDLVDDDQFGRQSDSLAEFSTRVSSASEGNRIYRWDYGEWGPCSASCLGGKQKSTLKCVDLSRKQSVPWSFCDAKKRPIDLSRSCNKQACPPSWEIGEFTDCSHSCNGGIRTRRVRCTRKVSRVGGAESTLILPEEQCSSSVPKPNDQEPCGVENCPASWKVGQWSSCSASCGNGEQRRTVECEQQDALGTLRVFNPPNQCLGLERPPSVQLCSMGSCEEVLPHSQHRPPSSMALVQGLTKPLNDDPRLDYDNNDNSQQESGEYGSVSHQRNDYYDQGHPNHKKLTLNVGGYANLYEGTSIKVKCPVRNFDRQRIYWTKDGKKLVNNAHTKVSANGALRIFHARMEDAGLYACFADGVHGNVTLKFKHREANQSSNKERVLSNDTNPKAKQNINNDQKGSKLKNSTANASSNKMDRELLQKIRNSLHSLGEHRVFEKLNQIDDPSGINVDFAMGEWSKCSSEGCGKPEGAQVRMLKCRIHVDQLTAYVDDEICLDFGVLRPPATRPCHDSDCPQWDASDWSDCFESRCVRHATALQRREVKCLYANGTEAEFSLCDRKNRPKIKKECVNLNCTAEWRPSVWGKCSKSCGDGGVQMRLLRCVWHGTKKAAGRNCDPVQRPPAIRACESATTKNNKLSPCEVGNDGEESGGVLKSNDSWTKNDLLNNNTVGDVDVWGMNGTKGVEYSVQSAGVDQSEREIPLDVEPFKGWQKWRGWRLYSWHPPSQSGQHRKI